MSNRQARQEAVKLAQSGDLDSAYRTLLTAQDRGKVATPTKLILELSPFGLDKKVIESAVADKVSKVIDTKNSSVTFQWDSYNNTKTFVAQFRSKESASAYKGTFNVKGKISYDEVEGSSRIQMYPTVSLILYPAGL